MSCLGVILAGGTGERLGGRDNGAVLLAGELLIRHVYRRFAAQVDRVVVNASTDYGLGLPIVADLQGGVEGPAAGLGAALAWVEARPELGIEAIASVPVDGPFLPCDLVARLSAVGGVAVAQSGNHLHPTFAYWPLHALQRCRHLLVRRQGMALTALAEGAGARHVRFDEAWAFFNLNRPEDLASAEAFLAAGG